MPACGHPDSHLLVLRGNSGSGKSSVARALRAACGYGLAWVEQDHLRRVLLREHDRPGAANIGLIDQTVRYALNHGFHVVLEGILYADHYADMLRDLHDDHAGHTHWYRFDLSFDETTRRHATRPQAQEFGVDAMREWYRPLDPLPFTSERVLDAGPDLPGVTALILAETGLPRDGLPRQFA